MYSSSNYPTQILFDIDVLVNVAQPAKILVVGDVYTDFLDEYITQKKLLNQECTVVHIATSVINTIQSLDEQFDVAIGMNLFEHIDKQSGTQILSRLRDVLSRQYCVCLPLSNSNSKHWQLNDLFAYGLERVSTYKGVSTYEGVSTQKPNSIEPQTDITYGLFKYNINDYKKNPDWLNSDNWANPDMWGKYSW